MPSQRADQAASQAGFPSRDSGYTPAPDRLLGGVATYAADSTHQTTTRRWDADVGELVRPDPVGSDPGWWTYHGGMLGVKPELQPAHRFVGVEPGSPPGLWIMSLWLRRYASIHASKVRAWLAAA